MSTRTLATRRHHRVAPWVVALGLATGAAQVGAQGDPARGRGLYEQTPGGTACAACHGEASLGLLRLQFGVDASVTRAAIVAGKGGMNLPNLLSLSDADLQDIAAHIANPVAGGGAAVPRLEPASSLDFDRAAVGGQAAERPVLLRNPGPTPLSLVSARVDGAGFSLRRRCDEPVPPAGQCELLLGHEPSAVGPASGRLEVAWAGAAAPLTLNLTGQGVAGPLAMLRWRDTAPLGAVVESLVGSAQPVATVQLENYGPRAATIGRLGLDGPGASDYALSGSCVTAGSVVPAGARCDVAITVTPTAIGRRSARVVLESDGGAPAVLALEAFGKAAGPALAVEPASLAVATRVPIEVRNPGAAGVLLIGLDVRGEAFRVQPGSCAPLPRALAPGASCTAEVSRAAGTALASQAELVVRTSTGGLEARVPLRASAVDATGSAAATGNVGAGTALSSVAGVLAMLGLGAAGAMLRRAGRDRRVFRAIRPGNRR